MVIYDTGPVEGIYAFIYCTKWRSGQVLPIPYGQTLKDRATQLPIKYKSGALVTQCINCYSRLFDALCGDSTGQLKASFPVSTRGEQGEIFPGRIDPGQIFPGQIFPGRIFPGFFRKWRAREKVKRRII